MSRSVKQPIGQKRLTNVAVVRYKKMGKRFEIACYKNKILNWRRGIEKDLDEVLQTITVFSNVSKATLAKQEDLQEVFGTTDQKEICLKILAEGEIQVSDKERELEYETLFKDVASIIADKCINPDTRRPYTISTLERALRDIHFSVDPKRSAKQQALEAIPLLQKSIKIQRARMRLRLQVPAAGGQEIRDYLKTCNATIESQDLSLEGDQVVIVALVEPGAYRGIHQQVMDVSGGNGRLAMLSLAVTDAADPAEAGPATPPPTADARDGGGTEPSGGGHEAAGPAEVPQSQGAGGAGPAAEPARVVPKKILYPRGPVGGMPEEYAGRRERFLELDALEPGWTVELRGKNNSSIMDAVFFSPQGQEVGPFANARRAALTAHKKAEAAAPGA